VTNGRHRFVDGLGIRAAPPVREGVLRVDAIGHVPVVLRDLGLDPDATIAATGIEPRVFDDWVNEIPIASLGRLLALSKANSGCDHVGLLVGERSGLASLGLLGLLTRHSPDVFTALRNFSAHLSLRDRGAVALMANGVATLGYEIYHTGVEGSDQIYDGAMAIAANIMRDLCGSAWRPTEVLFAHGRPADLRPFRRVFDAPLRFDADRTALVFASSWLEQRVKGADPVLFRRVAEGVAAAESRMSGDLVVELRRMLRVMLLTGSGSVGEVADQLSMHRRTLNRRLRARDTTLHRLLEETRFEIARQLVVNTRMPLTDVAGRLGYSDASSLTRAFRRWAGRPPSALRQELGGAPVAN